ncbi:MAG: hypothetical protein ACK55Z_17160 [bacterium]
MKSPVVSTCPPALGNHTAITTHNTANFTTHNTANLREISRHHGDVAKGKKKLTLLQVVKA